jgi:tripartite-type tricarboxylate transporter receptor subunit TctC
MADAMSGRCGARAAALLVAATSASLACAQANFPSKPLRLIIPYPPGGPTDVVGRVVAAKMGEGMKQTVVVDNRSGASGLIGTAELAKAAPDGYTMLFHIVTTAAINPHIYRKVQFDWIKDFQPLARIAIVPNVLLINKDVPARNVRELIALAKGNPGKLTYASSGNASLLHLSGALFAQQAGIDILHVPYKGAAPAMVDIMSGAITMIFANIPGLLGTIRSGQMRALAVTTAERVPALPDVPTMVESGLPNFQNASWFSLFTRAGVPAPVLHKLEAEALRAINNPDTVARLNDLGAVPAPLGAVEFGKFWRSEIEYWRPIVLNPAIKLEEN